MDIPSIAGQENLSTGHTLGRPILDFSNVHACFACLRCAAGGNFVSSGGALWAPEVTLINYKEITSLNMSVLLSKSISLEKSSNFQFLMRNIDVIKE